MVRLPSPKELQASGFNVPDYERVEVVHSDGVISSDEIKARMTQ